MQKAKEESHKTPIALKKSNFLGEMIKHLYHFQKHRIYAQFVVWKHQHGYV